MKNLVEIFDTLEDPRDNRGKRHKLTDVIVMSIYAIICGNFDCENIADWLMLRKDFFINLLSLENGIPSADTFLRIFSSIEPEKFMTMFSDWIKSIVDSAGKVIAIDGKAIKSAADKINGGNIPYVVSAFLTEAGLSFCQIKVDDKSNEITAIPELLDMLDLKDAIITIDAIGTQKNIVKKIVEKQGHYCLNLKENQKNMYVEVKEYFDFALNDKDELSKILKYETKSLGHGRIETREYYVLKDIDFLTEKDKWSNLKNIGLVKNKREINGKVSIQYKFYITDIDISAEKLADISRNHWKIENNLHWILDVHFREDWSKSKKDNIIQNLALLRKICYNIVKLDDSFGNISSKKKLNRYNYDFSNLNNVLFNVITKKF